jgi:hypothetical protein
MASQRAQSCEHRRRAFEHPPLYVQVKHPAQKPVVCELTLKVRKLGTWTVPRETAEPVIESLT